MTKLDKHNARLINGAWVRTLHGNLGWIDDELDDSDADPQLANPYYHWVHLPFLNGSGCKAYADDLTYIEGQNEPHFVITRAIDNNSMYVDMTIKHESQLTQEERDILNASGMIETEGSDVYVEKFITLSAAFDFWACETEEGQTVYFAFKEDTGK